MPDIVIEVKNAIPVYPKRAYHETDGSEGRRFEGQGRFRTIRTDKRESTGVPKIANLSMIR